MAKFSFTSNKASRVKNGRKLHSGFEDIEIKFRTKDSNEQEVLPLALSRIIDFYYNGSLHLWFDLEYEYVGGVKRKNVTRGAFVFHQGAVFVCAFDADGSALRWKFSSKQADAFVDWMKTIPERDHGSE